MDNKKLLGAPSREMEVRKKVVATELEDILLIEKISKRQKSQTLQLKEGDKCNNFFHKLVISPHRNNVIAILQVGESIILDKEAIEDHAVYFFENMFWEDFSLRLKLDSLHFNSID